MYFKTSSVYIFSVKESKACKADIEYFRSLWFQGTFMTDQTLLVLKLYM